jgi:predicted DNA-binding transcriptional regulator AlpA
MSDHHNDVIAYGDDELWDVRKVIEKTGLSRTTIASHVENGAMPKPRRLGKILVWVRSEMIAWMHNLPAATPNDLKKDA